MTIKAHPYSKKFTIYEPMLIIKKKIKKKKKFTEMSIGTLSR